MIKLLRPHQWAKQAIIFLPLLSLGSFVTLGDVLVTFGAVVSFTLSAGFVYVINDYFDLEHDKQDAIRRLRPIASGKIPVRKALVFACISLFLSFLTNFLFSDMPTVSSLILLFYVVINLSYSKFKLKRFNTLGISIVASGFSIRFAFGSVFLSIKMSYWALILLMELALFMLSVKRFQVSQRLIGDEDTSRIHDFWLLAAVIFSAMFSSSYAGFIMSPETQAIWGFTALKIATIPIALGMVRFIELAAVRKNKPDTDVTDSVVRDVPMLILVGMYLLIMFCGRLLTI